MGELTEQQVAEWERLAAQATSGPWYVGRPHHIRWQGPTSAFVIMAGDTPICERPWAEGNPAAIREHEANATFLTAARTALPALCAAWRAQRQEIARLTAALAVRSGAGTTMED